MDATRFPGGVWLVDFEFHPRNGRDGNRPEPVCMVARELHSGRTLRLWRDELVSLSAAPFPVDDSALFVAYYASAKFGCFLALGWPLPHHILDLFSEFRTQTNGRILPAGNGLLGALAYHGLDSIAAGEKDAKRDLVLRGAPWSGAEQQAILDYCETDVVALEKLLPAMQAKLDWLRALLRGQYSAAAAHIEANGVPLDVSTLEIVRANWDAIQGQMGAAI